MFCCNPCSATANTVGPVSVAPGCGEFELVEVRPGRVLRVRHAVPERPPGSETCEDPADREHCTLRCRRRICVYKNGQMYIENSDDGEGEEVVSSGGGSGSGEPLSAKVGEPGPPVATGNSGGAENRSPLPSHSRNNSNTRPSEFGHGKGACSMQSSAASLGGDPSSTQPPTPGIPVTNTQPRRPRRSFFPRFRHRRRKPKKTVLVECERVITSCRGTDSDVVLFFFHGVGGSLEVWREQLRALSALGYECVAPDLLGHGGSSAPDAAAAYTFAALAEDMRFIFRRYAKRRNVLVGHSYGVSFCTFLAHEYPEQVCKVVLINGGGPTPLEPSVCSVFNLPSCVLHCISPCLAWAFLKAGFARQGTKEKQLLRDGNAFSVPPLVLRATMSGQYWPEGDELYHAALTVPTLIVHGLHDRFVPIEEDQRMAEILLIAFLKAVEDGSHMVMLECPEAVNTLLQDFLLWEYRPPPSSQPDATATTPRQEDACEQLGTTAPNHEAPSVGANVEHLSVPTGAIGGNPECVREGAVNGELVMCKADDRDRAKARGQVSPRVEKLARKEKVVNREGVK
ncbi:protein ABHD8 [Lampetra planeri]